MKLRKVCVITGSRADYGILYWLMKEIQSDKALKLQVIATGMHLSPEFGLTYQVIEGDGFKIEAKVATLLSSDTPAGVAKSIGLGVIGFADAFEWLRPDVVVVLGDRFEILAAVQAAMVANIPVAHISGGEVTEGAIDDSIRHAITKMADFHFVAAEPYRNRVIQMGEQPRRVMNYGDPGLDNLERLKLLSRGQLEKSLGFKLGEKFFLVTYHPVTRGKPVPWQGMEQLLIALDQWPGVNVLFTKPNADSGGRQLGQMIDEYALARRQRVHVATSLGQQRYLSAMKHCAAVVGNSSSGIVEAPAFNVPTVNMGRRQNGRLKASSIIDCGETSAEIDAAIKRAMSPAFRKHLPHTESRYGNCDASSRIKNFLKRARLSRSPKKFFDLPGMGGR